MAATAGFREFLSPLVFLALVAAALGYGCGRTSLDEGLEPVGGLGGRIGTGGSAAGSQGGRSGGLGGQAGFGAPNLCGTSVCRAGSEVCCNRMRAGQPSQTCVPAGDPMACAGGLSTACVQSSQCGMGQTCCFSLLSQSTSCVAPPQCGNGLGELILCSSSSSCPASAPRCCPVVQGVGACVPGNTPC
jgi:hypothetical protein